MEGFSTEGLLAGIFLAEGAMPENGDVGMVVAFRFGHREGAGSFASRLDGERRRSLQSSKVRFDPLS